LCKLSLELTGLNFSESLQTVAKVEKKWVPEVKNPDRSWKEESKKHPTADEKLTDEAAHENAQRHRQISCHGTKQ
jgi:hypothetical protein